MNKKCNKCRRVKSLAEFYKHPLTSDGRAGLCKVCHKAAVMTNRTAKSDYYKEFDRQRAFRPDRVAARKANAKAVSADPIRKAHRDIVVKRRNEAVKGTLKRQANIAVGNAIRDGKLSPEPCAVCGTDEAQAHHEDYSAALDVVWLCPQHHGERHREINAATRTTTEGRPDEGI